MRRIGKYEVLGLLGRGGMGAVYKVRHPGLGLVAALKVLAPSDMLAAVVGGAELERRFLAEARAMAGLRHDNVARVFDLDRDGDGRPFFVLEYCCDNVGALIGETYEVEAATRVLPLARAAGIARQTLLALERLHAGGMVHRDVKPFNLLLTETGGVRLIDFGLSRLRGERMRLHGAEQVGSPYYAAPEQEADPEAADARADLYSVGVTLWRMLTGGLPQCGRGLPSQMNPDLDADWDAFLARSMAADRAERFASASGMIRALDALVAAWEERTAGTCALAPAPAAPEGNNPVSRPRGEPLRTGPRVGPERFGLDALWRPLAYAPQDFEARGGAVLHRATELVWEREGSLYPLDWHEARAYAAGRNRTLAPGEAPWRLPTVEELASLLMPVAHGRDYCVAPVFETRGPRLWSADLRTWTQAWSADAELGFISRHDLTCRNHVRLVRSSR
ncbi:protein kinase domain-containing protein [Desulfocurvus sp. DL9XJH121]